MPPWLVIVLKYLPTLVDMLVDLLSEKRDGGFTMTYEEECQLHKLKRIQEILKENYDGQSARG